MTTTISPSSFSPLTTILPSSTTNPPSSFSPLKTNPPYPKCNIDENGKKYYMDNDAMKTYTESILTLGANQIAFVGAVFLGVIFFIISAVVFASSKEKFTLGNNILYMITFILLILIIKCQVTITKAKNAMMESTHRKNSRPCVDMFSNRIILPE